uniref:Uncharacterized protein n=1 Tax=Oryza meridionalis TaxID=40149 RepID=A0A0E0DEL6_9ORYZ
MYKMNIFAYFGVIVFALGLCNWIQSLGRYRLVLPPRRCRSGFALLASVVPSSSSSSPHQA